MFRTDNDVATVSAANLIVRHVDVAAAAKSGKVSGRLAVQHAIAAQTLPAIIQDRVTAARVRPEHQVRDLSVAAYLTELVIDLLATAGVIVTIDERLTAAFGVTAVRLLDDCVLAALVGVMVVDAGSAAR